MPTRLDSAPARSPARRCSGSDAGSFRNNRSCSDASAPPCPPSRSGGRSVIDLRLAEPWRQPHFRPREAAAAHVHVVEPPARAVERHRLAFKRQVRRRRVGEHRAVRVSHGDRHRVVDVDALVEDASVAQVAILRLAVHVEGDVALAGRHVPRKRTRRAMRTRAAVGAADTCCCGRTPAGRLTRRPRPGPNPATSWPGRNGVTPCGTAASRSSRETGAIAEVVRAVAGVEILVEVHGQHVADGAVLEQRLDLLRLARVSRVVRRPSRSAGPRDGVEIAWHCVSSVHIGFSVRTSTPSSSAPTM